MQNLEVVVAWSFDTNPALPFFIRKVWSLLRVNVGALDTGVEVCEFAAIKQIVHSRGSSANGNSANISCRGGRLFMQAVSTANQAASFQA